MQSNAHFASFLDLSRYHSPTPTFTVSKLRTMKHRARVTKPSSSSRIISSLRRSVVILSLMTSICLGMLLPYRTILRPRVGGVTLRRLSTFERTGLQPLIGRLSSLVLPTTPHLLSTRLLSSTDSSQTEITSLGNEYSGDFAEALVEEELDSSDDDDDEEESISLPKGSNEGFYIVKTYKTSDADFDMEEIRTIVGDDSDRLELTSNNVSVPVALMLLDSDEFPSLSRARKACRKANIMIHRGPLNMDETTGKELFDSSKCIRARVGDRVFPGDVIGKQVRMSDGCFHVLNHKKPPFDLPVVYEDDHFAICNKPPGVVVYAHRGGGHGIMTVRAALPFSVKPPSAGTLSTLRRPQPVHRLDKPTSGLIIVAKTKTAMVHLSLQFRDRKVKKTYVAIVNGIPPEPVEAMVSANEARSLGVDVESGDADTKWQIIDHTLDEKHATTVWRSLNYTKSLKASDNIVTLVELKPKTGRYHQLRRHMAWVCERPIVGDTIYDGGGTAMRLRGSGLFLCSNRVTLEHPYYNSPLGREEFDKMRVQDQQAKDCLWLSDDGTVMVSAEIDLPAKFESFMNREEERYNRLSEEEP